MASPQWSLTDMQRPNQIVKGLCDIPDTHELLDKALKHVHESWHGLGGVLLVTLTNEPTILKEIRGVRRSGLGLPLHEAWTRLCTAGFSMWPTMLGRLDPELHLSAADFELLLTLWPKLEGVELAGARGHTFVRDWVGVKLLAYYETPDGAAELAPATLQRFRPLWAEVVPTVAQRLSPKRACALGWSAAHTVALIETHVDTNGDTEELVRELLRRDLLTPQLVNAHQGLAGGLLLANPAWLAEHVLAGEVSLEAPQPTVARMAAAALAGWTKPLTAQNVKHLTRFVEESIAPMADKTNAMHVAIDSLVSLIRRVPAEGNATARSSLIGRVTGAFVDDAANESRVAQVPDPRATSAGAAPRNARTMSVCTYPVLLERLLPQLTLTELTDSARLPPSSADRHGAAHHAHALPASLRESFRAWAHCRIETEHATAQTLLKLLPWLAAICTRSQSPAISRNAMMPMRYV